MAERLEELQVAGGLCKQAPDPNGLRLPAHCCGLSGRAGLAVSQLHPHAVLSSVCSFGDLARRVFSLQMLSVK